MVICDQRTTNVTGKQGQFLMPRFYLETTVTLQQFPKKKMPLLDIRVTLTQFAALRLPRKLQLDLWCGCSTMSDQAYKGKPHFYKQTIVC